MYMFSSVKEISLFMFDCWFFYRHFVEKFNAVEFLKRLALGQNTLDFISQHDGGP